MLFFNPERIITDLDLYLQGVRYALDGFTQRTQILPPLWSSWRNLAFLRVFCVNQPRAHPSPLDGPFAAESGDIHQAGNKGDGGASWPIEVVGEGCAAEAHGAAQQDGDQHHP